MGKKRRRTIGFLVILVILCGILLLIWSRVNPLTETLALTKVSDAASDVINQAVNTLVTEENIRYGDLVTLERDSSGNIVALTTNMQEMNRLKTGLLLLLDAGISGISRETISVPLGNLTGLQLLSGRGPRLPVEIVSVSSTDAVFSGEFSDAGINQTIHKIVLQVSVELVVLLPSGTVTERVDTDVCVAETVLLGPVPDSYIYFSSTEDPSDTTYFAS